MRPERMNSMPTGTIATTAGIAMAWLQREREVSAFGFGWGSKNQPLCVCFGFKSVLSAALRGPNKTRGWDLSFAFSFKYARKKKKEVRGFKKGLSLANTPKRKREGFIKESLI